MIGTYSSSMYYKYNNTSTSVVQSRCVDCRLTMCMRLYLERQLQASHHQMFVVPKQRFELCAAFVGGECVRGLFQGVLSYGRRQGACTPPKLQATHIYQYTSSCVMLLDPQASYSSTSTRIYYCIGCCCRAALSKHCGLNESSNPCSSSVLSHVKCRIVLWLMAFIAVLKNTCVILLCQQGTRLY